MTELEKSPLIMLEDAVKYLGISTATLARMRRDNNGPAYIKLGRRVFYRKSDLDAFINNSIITGETNE